MPATPSPSPANADHHPLGIQTGTVVGNDLVCREHYRLRLRMPQLGPAAPGQFVHLGGAAEGTEADRAAPLLRRAFSIAGLERDGAQAELVVIYRVVGRGTAWLARLEPGQRLSVLGPVGKAFPLPGGGQRAELVAGGVGLPPMLWLAEALARAGVACTVFCGARSADLLPLQLVADAAVQPDATAATARLCVAEFARVNVPAVISTDDGSAGWRGSVADAWRQWSATQAEPAAQRVVYTCGPEPLMRSVAETCVADSVQCYVCLERAMACGIGTCQSCVVPVRDTSDADGWRYALCCTEGPVFDARDVHWDDPQRRR